ncbi:hypothetical protein [Vibrio metschnikovii]|uniref:hypothetical protein n=1 Tax=Vibrio metschnikovii TaxID=28172 RepID=UPI001C2FFC9E|nr:hypothetical protein [Vibrio metschnikovii]
MLEKEVITLVLGTGLISALVTALFSKFVSDKSHKIENITKERKEWRDRLRSIVIEVVKASQAEDVKALKLLEAELIVRLNPKDKEDQLILKSLENISNDWSATNIQEFCDRVSYLLKHDWERVKQETNTTVSNPSLLCATVVATTLLTLIGILNGMWVYFLFSGLILILVLLIPTMIDFFIIKRNKRPKDKLELALYLCNHKDRDKYEARGERN